MEANFELTFLLCVFICAQLYNLEMEHLCSSLRVQNLN